MNHYKSEYPNIIEINENLEESSKSLIDYEFFVNRTIWITGMFDDPMDGVKIVIAIDYLASCSDEDITLKISNYGGQLDCMWMIVNAMDRAKCDIRTEIHGEANSCAGFIFINGTKGKRFMTPHSFLMLHETSWGTETMTHSYNSNQYKNYYSIHAEELAKYVSSKCNMDAEKTYEWLKKDNWLTPEKAIEMGFCDHILN